MKRHTRTIPFWILLLSAFACAGPQVDDFPETARETAATDLSALEDRQVFEPQLLLEDDGRLLVVWREKTTDGFDLLVAHRTEAGTLSEPVRINDEPGTVYAYPHDEMRPGVATGPGGLIGVAWADERAQIRAAIGSDHGRSWRPSVRLDQEGTPAYRSFTAAGFDGNGVLHAVWIDSRLAPQAGAEEPADLFYARLDEGRVTEVNLTADQEPTICGCCRPALGVEPDGTILATFRNSTIDGYRDIFRVRGSVGDGFSAPTRVGPPLWKLAGCPMSGPLDLGEQVLWADGSTGRKVVMTASKGEANEPLFTGEADAGWSPTFAIRRVEQVGAAAPMLLAPGRPATRLLAREGTGWAVRDGELPQWVTSAAVLGDRLLVVGAVDGAIAFETRPLAR